MLRRLGWRSQRLDFRQRLHIGIGQRRQRQTQRHQLRRVSQDGSLKTAKTSISLANLKVGKGEVFGLLSEQKEQAITRLVKVENGESFKFKRSLHRSFTYLPI
jgi:hypothetical protein